MRQRLAEIEAGRAGYFNYEVFRALCRTRQQALAATTAEKRMALRGQILGDPEAGRDLVAWVWGA